MRYFLIVLLLSGCGGVRGIQQGRADVMIWRDSTLCERLGYEKDSEEWKRCIVDQQRRR